jgi:hypothetical protein
MARKATGKPLTLFPIRVDEDVKAAILKLKELYDTINEGLRASLLHGNLLTPESERRIAANVRPRNQSKRAKAVADLAASDLTAQAVGRDDIEYGNHEETPRGQHVANIGKRPIREKGDKTR